MHQQPPKTPLLRSTTSAKASQVEASSGRTQYAICSVIDSSIEAARLASGPNSVPLPGITRRDVQEWVNTMAASGLAPATVRHAYRAVFKSVLNDAIDDGLLACSPCYRIELPAAAVLVIEPLTPAQILALADRIDPRYRVMVLLAAGCGLRWSEAARLPGELAAADLAAH